MITFSKNWPSYVSKYYFWAKCNVAKEIFLLRSGAIGFVPLAPVGPPNSVRVSQACHWLLRHKWRFWRAEEGTRVWNTSRGGALACRWCPEINVHLLGVTRLKTRTRSIFLNYPMDATRLHRRVGDNSSVWHGQRTMPYEEEPRREDRTVHPQCLDPLNFLRERCLQELKNWPSQAFSLLIYTGCQKTLMRQVKLRLSSIGCVSLLR